MFPATVSSLKRYDKQKISMNWVRIHQAFLRTFFLSHNNPCFQCNIAIMNFLVLHTLEIRLHDAKGQSTVHMYSYAKILKHG